MKNDLVKTRLLNTTLQGFKLSRKLILLSSWALVTTLPISLSHAKVNSNVQQVEAGKVTKASAYTINKNNEVAASLNLEDQKDFEEARRGLIASPKDLKIKSKNDPDRLTWDMSKYRFIQGDAPDTVNPSLWRQAKLNDINGLFEVKPGIYQLRGFDLANMTLIKGDTGWIVVDPLGSKETSHYAYDFAMQHLASRYPNFTKVSAIVFTHSHIDHFGGVLGIVNEDIVKQQNIPVVAPQGFMEEATSENIIAGPAMMRRAAYMYGSNLDINQYGHVDTGLGKGPSIGESSILTPNTLIAKTVTDLTIDGVKFQFQYTPASEAPAEFVFYLPEFNAYCGAEVVSRNMHNLYTLRGAKVRDALKWSGYIEQSRLLFGDADVYFGSHQWPVWGQKNVQNFLVQQRDTYKYIHDQTVRRLNSGMNAGEIADDIAMPKSLANVFSSRGYYGTLKHNSRAVYQNYLGWYDANPAHLDQLPDPKRAVGYVKLAGGSDKLLKQAQTAYDNGNYRWSAELLNHLVFAEPTHKVARELLASTYDQLGYQAESGPWRDIYLTGAQELRKGISPSRITVSNMKDQFMQTPISQLLTSLAVSLKAEEAEDSDLKIVFDFTDLNERYLVWIENAVFHYRVIEGNSSQQEKVDATLQITHPLFIDLITKNVGFEKMLASNDSSIKGDPKAIVQLFSLLEQPKIDFPIVTAN